MLTVKTLLGKNLITQDLMLSKQAFPDFTILVNLVLAAQSGLVQICSEGLCMWEVDLSECLKHACSRDVYDSSSIFMTEIHFRA